MFVRPNCNKSVSREEIEMKELQSQPQVSIDLTKINFGLPIITFDVAKLKSISNTALKLDVSSIIDELKRTPKKTYVHAEPKNETESLIPRILDDIWIEIFSHLDLPTLALMMVSCKKMADLANDNGVRERLYLSKQNHFFKSLLPKPNPLELVFDRSPELTRLLRQIPAQQHIPTLTPILQDQQVYNDNPPGQGFVMR